MRDIDFERTKKNIVSKLRDFIHELEFEDLIHELEFEDRSVGIYEISELESTLLYKTLNYLENLHPGDLYE